MKSKCEGKGVLLHRNVLFWVENRLIERNCSRSASRVYSRSVHISLSLWKGGGGGLFEKERDRVGAWVCVSTCYITKSGGRECCLACHTTAALQWE